MKRHLLIIMVFAFIGFDTNAQAPNWEWAKGMGGNYADYGRGIATDAIGNVYVAGNFEGPTIIFGTDTLINAGDTDFYIVKYDPSGNIIWVKREGGIYNDYCYAITIDLNGDLLITGSFRSPSIIVGSDTLINSSGYSNILVAKYDSFGNALWAKMHSGNNIIHGFDIITDSNNNIFVTGQFSSHLTVFDSITLTNSSGTDMFIVKYNTYGNVLWAKNTGGNLSDFGFGVTIDNSDNVFVTGTFSSPTISFGSTILTNAGITDMFIVKYSTSGNLLWCNSIGGNSSEQGRAVTTDANGNVIVTGEFSSPTIICGSTTLTNTGDYDVFIIKYSPSGNILWANSVEGSGQGGSTDIITDADGSILVAGFYYGTATFGTITLTNTGSCYLFVAKYDNSGNVLWVVSAFVGSVSFGYGIATNAIGNVFVSGEFYGPNIIFGTTTLNSLNNPGDTPDMFIAKLNCTVGIEEPQYNSTPFHIAPNPFSSSTTLSFSESQKNTTIHLTDLLGKEIKSFTFSGKEFVLEKGEVKAGIYFLQVNSSPSLSLPEGERNTLFKKIIIQ